MVRALLRVPARMSNLAIRLLSAAILVPLFLFILWRGEFGFYSVMLLCCLWGGYEWLAMINRPPQKTVWVVVLFLLALSWGIALHWDANIALLFCLVSSLLLMLGFRLFDVKRPVLLSLAVAYLGAAMLAFLFLRQIGGYSLTAFVCASVWLTDTGAYFAGRAIKGLRMAPDISPSKTWAGFVGGLLAAMLMAGFCAWLFSAHKPLVVIGVGALLSLAAQMGDLFESWLKREAGVKDSGDVIPGHGGLLDRIDGLLMAMLIFVTGLWASGFNLTWWF